MKSKETAEERSIRNAMRWMSIVLCLALIILTYSFSTAAQESNGGGSIPEKRESGNTADKNLRSLAKVNPSTLALEMSLPLMSYPGRNGNTLSVDFRYSSKVWRFKDVTTWFTGSGSNRSYITDVYPLYAERSAGGWTSSLVPPRIDEEQVLYNEAGGPYADSVSNTDFTHAFEVALMGQSPSSGIFCEGWTPTYVLGVEICNIFYYSIEGGDPQPEPQQPDFNSNNLYYVKRLRVVMPDGSSHEFRKSDLQNPFNGGTFSTPAQVNLDGTFLAVDGSGLTLDHDANGYVLRLPNGGYYNFPNEAQNEDGLFATSFTDINGNRVTYQETGTSPGHEQLWTDTLGRHIVDPIPHNWLAQAQRRGTQNVELPGLSGTPQQYHLTWDNLKPPGCEDSNSSTCTGGALEDQSERLFYSASSACKGNLPLVPDLFPDVLFPLGAQGVRPCNEFAIVSENGTNIAVPVRFNPVVLTQIVLPNGQHYDFKYNRYGEISRITYPTGSYERFVHAAVPELGGWSGLAHSQTNRGEVERRVYEADSTIPVQTWTYASANPQGLPPNSYNTITIEQYKGNNTAATPVSKTVTYSYQGEQQKFGYSDPRTGMPFDERAYDEDDNLRSRVLTEYVTKDIQANWNALVAHRDLRVKRKVSIRFEPGSSDALATLNETNYDENPSIDESYFSHLNVKSQKSYHYVPISVSTAENGSLATIAGLFPSSKLASVSETDYLYSPEYKDRGITSLPIETRVLDPANLNNVLAKTQTLYDEPTFLVADSPEFIVGDFEPTWINPLTDPSIPPNSRALRGNPTTTKVWDKDDNGTWIEKHTQYDQYGNVRKAWEANEGANSSRFTETQYSLSYACAYPTKIIAPAPNVGTSVHGTSETSTVETAYDFHTGLPIAVKDDFGQITTTEYDVMLRPKKVNPVVMGGNPTGPVTETFYNDDARTVTVKKQLDATHWDEATTFFDSFGRAVKTKANDSQGDVIVETHYDLLGRVDRVTNPYRTGDIIYWSKTSYDAAGRAVEAFAPAEINATPDSLGKTSYGISTVTGYVGTVVTTEDASGRKSRSITNALGQLMRVDEPVSVSENPDTDLGTIAAPAQPTYYTYDAYGKMVKVEQGQQTRFFKYDSLGRLIRVRQPEQDVNLSLATSGNPDNNSWTAGFTYDILGNVLTATDANGTVITNTYDRAGRVITRSYNDTTTSGFATTPSVNFYYDGKGLAQQQSPNYAKGKLTKVDNGVSATEYMTFDNFGRLTRSRQITDGVVYGTDEAPMTYSYNLSGALIEEKYPSGRVVKNEFENDGDLLRISSKQTANTSFTTFANGFSYTADGKIAKLKLGNNLWESATFNNRLQVTELNLGHSAVVNPNDPGGDLWKLGYKYGELNEDGTVNEAKNTGNVAKQILDVPGVQFVQDYRYDSLYRLTSAKETSGETETWSQSFQYDRYGNRTGFHQRIGDYQRTDATPTIDPLTNRFTDLTTFAYDQNGNITRDIDQVTNQLRTYIFNGDNKQSEIRDPNGHAIGRYYYDGEGKRVKKLTDTETTVFVYSSGKLVAEYSTALPPTNPSINYTATDMLGSPRVITNELGNVVSRRDFMPFGEDVPTEAGDRAHVQDINTIAEVDGNGNLRTTALNYQSTDAIRQRFTGYQKDSETSLDFAEARMYESRYGRFTAVDPLLTSGKSANPQSFNRYVYVMNNPLRLTDPKGLQSGTNPYWASRDTTADNGDPAIQFYRFRSEFEQTTLEGAWGGGKFQRWTGNDYYVFGDKTALFMGRNGSGAGFLFSTENIPLETMNGLITTQQAGEQFSFNQRIFLDRASNDTLWCKPEIEKAKSDGAFYGTLGAGAIYSVEESAAVKLRSAFADDAASAGALTNRQLVQRAADIAEARIGGSGAVNGTLKHSYAEKLINRYQGIFGDRGLLTETSWINGQPALFRGQAGSVRFDVLDTSTNFAYDFKFVVRPPGLSAGRRSIFQSNGPNNLRNVFEINPTR